MRIHRSHPDDHFTIIPNETLRDQRLTYNARGVLMELLSHVDGWNTSADDLSQLARRHRGEKSGEGRRGLRSAFAELEELGYLVRRRERRERGRFVTILELYDTPGHQGAETGTSVMGDPWAEADRGAADGTSVDGTSVGATSVSGTSLRSTNTRSTNEEALSQEHSSWLAAARAAAAEAAARSQIEQRLQDFYSAVNRLPHQDLRNWLLTLEQKRPRIFKTCRRQALRQYKNENPAILKADVASLAMDRLVYKYALLHYMPAPPAKHDWVPWVIRPLEPLIAAGAA